MAMADNNRALTKVAVDYDGSTPLPEIRHELFVSGILQGMTLDKAYAAAGFKPRRSSASILRHKPHIIARLAYRRAQLAEHLAVTEERLLGEMAKLAFANMQDFGCIDAEGKFSFKDWSELSRDQLAAVESVSVTTTRTVSKKGNEYETQHVKLSLHNKQVSQEQLGKNLGSFEKDNRQKENGFEMFLAFLSGNGDHGRNDGSSAQK